MNYIGPETKLRERSKYSLIEEIESCGIIRVIFFRALRACKLVEASAISWVVAFE